MALPNPKAEDSELDALRAERDALREEVDRLQKRIEEEAPYLEPFRNLVEKSMVGIYVIQDGRVVYCNPRIAEIYGYSQEEILAWPDAIRAVVPEERQKVKRFLAQRLSGEVPSVHYTLTIIRKDGRRRILDVFGNRMLYRGRIAVIGSLIDETDRRMAERALAQSEERFRAVFESSALGITVTDPRTQTILKTNPAFQQMLGYSDSELRRLGIFGITHPDDRAATSSFIADVLSASRNQSELVKRYIRKDGSVVWARAVASVAGETGGVPSVLVSVIEDVTEIRQAREKIDQLLIREQKARVEAEEALQLRDEFVSAASHELLTPLTPLDLGFGVLDHWFRKKPRKDELSRLFESMKPQLARLRSTVRNLLEASQMQSGEVLMNRESLDLRQLVGEVLAESDDALKRAGCSLEFTRSGEALGFWDRTRLKQVLANLLSNAIKFGPGGPIAVSLRGEKEEVTFEVADQGVGIEEGGRARLFKRFGRAVSVSHYGGLGLGLYLSSEIVKAHGGVIEVESEPGRGARFVVRLPRTDSNGLGPKIRSARDS